MSKEKLVIRNLNTYRRPGFTLVEILVVIAIIAILAALVVGGVVSFMSKGPEIQTRNDLLQLSTALDKFYAKYKFYPPDQIKLCANYSQYNVVADKASLAYIGTMWPNLGQFTNVPWAGSTAIPATGIVLEGDQCLVFFLGGPPVGSTPGLMGGFSLNPRDPISIAGGVDRERFMDFDTGRLVNRPTVAYPTGHPFPSMFDRSDKRMPYVYFSSGRYGYDPTTPNSAGGFTPAGILTNPVIPYRELLLPPYNFHQKSRFQIISAGRDGLYGPGGVWTQATAGSMSLQGRDDMTSFYESKMGSP
ncbi:MAG: prepilin-type N-terminal cleavage/methylation domain-containing protein [Gemmataceae bacterium]|nr:prepilin-type N-terminal cleavage/methylation domain-containing protein [Gemmataceae bacterium]